MKKNLLSVRLHGEPIGILEQTPSGEKIFTYNSTNVMPISVGMPVREESYGDLQCEAFFGGLLPESTIVKKIIGKWYGVSPYNTFALLREIGYDCAGAISCHKIDEPITPQHFVPLIGKNITDDELYNHMRALPSKPLFMDVEGLRLSLAGAQDKAAICLIDNQIAFPEKGCPTTHILKPALLHFEGLAENEYFCLKIARRIGLIVPEIKLKKIKDITFLLIERYDRHIENKQVKRIHQEDFCQALGIPSFKKYQNEGGPGFKNCFELLNKTMHPAVDRNQLASALVFNYLIGNMDAHGKNFSLLRIDTPNIQLAPFYDIICTRVYQELTSKMAMKIGSKYDADYVLPRHWEQLCEEINYRHLAMVNLIETLGHQIMVAARQEKEEMKNNDKDNPIIDKIINFFDKNINKKLKEFTKLANR